MKIAIWKTGHPIADTVAEALAEGFDADIRNTSSAKYRQSITLYDACVAYGILRGCDDVFKAADRYGVPYFNVDRGYFNPGHYGGYYRISYKGTQARWYENIPRKPGNFRLKPITKRDGYILICPPTDHVKQFFGVDEWRWRITQPSREPGPITRLKGDPAPIDWPNIKAVVTFNSSVGWEALRRGIPVLSDINHSIIGSFYKAKEFNQLIDNFYSMPDTRLELFEAMNAHQFTLDEIRAGRAWTLLNHYLSSSATIAGRPSPPMLQVIV